MDLPLGAGAAMPHGSVHFVESDGGHPPRVRPGEPRRRAEGAIRIVPQRTSPCLIGLIRGNAIAVSAFVQGSPARHLLRGAKAPARARTVAIRRSQ